MIGLYTIPRIGSRKLIGRYRGVLPTFYLELTTGLHKGEIVALLRFDLDEANRLFAVPHSWD